MSHSHLRASHVHPAHYAILNRWRQVPYNCQCTFHRTSDVSQSRHRTTMYCPQESEPRSANYPTWSWRSTWTNQCIKLVGRCNITPTPRWALRIYCTQSSYAQWKRSGPWQQYLCTILGKPSGAYSPWVVRKSSSIWTILCTYRLALLSSNFQLQHSTTSGAWELTPSTLAPLGPRRLWAEPPYKAARWLLQASLRTLMRLRGPLHWSWTRTACSWSMSAGAYESYNCSRMQERLGIIRHTREQERCRPYHHQSSLHPGIAGCLGLLDLINFIIERGYRNLRWSIIAVSRYNPTLFGVQLANVGGHIPHVIIGKMGEILRG